MHIEEALDLLKHLIQTPSMSGNEGGTADIIETFFRNGGMDCQRVGNNVAVRNVHFSDAKPTLLLNSHHDTVKANFGYTLDPYTPTVSEGKLYGLGSNDAGGALVSLMAAFAHYAASPTLSHNLILLASAEEETSGPGGVALALPALGPIAMGIVGEPTSLRMAVAERGLMVIDCEAIGRAGHAARNEGENALYIALDDIHWLRNYRFEKISALLGDCKLTATAIHTENKQHNMIPSQCTFIIDVRVNELYAFDEVLATLHKHLKSKFSPRSTCLKSTSISLEHPLVQSGLRMGKTYYGSPTTSDKALMPFPVLKFGPGDSARSHMADEYIHIHEIEAGIQDYIDLLKPILR